MGIKKMKKICFCISDITLCGGTESVCISLANALCNHNYEVHILSISNQNKDTFFSCNQKIHLSKMLGKVEMKFFSKRPKYFTMKVYKYLLLHNIDVVIDVDIKMSNLTIPATKRLKNVKHIAWDNFSYECFMSVFHHQLALPKIKTHADAMVVLTERDRQLYMKEQNVPDGFIHQIYNPVSIKEDKPLSHSSFKVLSLGRFAHEKGFDLLLKAWAIVEKKIEGWTLDIWGDTGQDTGNVYSTFNQLKLERAFLHPSTKNVDQLFREAAIYVLPSRSEGLGLVLIEAGSFGLPLVAFDCPNGPREIIKNGENGFLVEPENVEQLAEKLLQLMNNESLRTRMGVNAYTNSKHFGVDAVLPQWIQLIENI